MEDISIYNKYLAFNDDTLMIENLYLKSLAKKYKTPFFCYSANQIKDNYQNLEKSFKKIKPVICYAVKANFNKKILNLVAKLGIGADVVSKGELEQSISCNIKISFSRCHIVIENRKYEVESKIFFRKNILGNQ